MNRMIDPEYIYVSSIPPLTILTIGHLLSAGGLPQTSPQRLLSKLICG